MKATNCYIIYICPSSDNHLADPFLLASMRRFGGQVSPVSLLLLCELALQPAFHLLVSHGSCEIKKKTQQNDGLKSGTPGVILRIWKCRFKDPILEANLTKLIYSKPWCKEDKKPAKWIWVHRSSSHFGGFWRTSRHGQV